MTEIARELKAKGGLTFEVSAGFSAKATAAAIAFLWSNWEVLYAFRPEKIRAIRRMATLPGVVPWKVPPHWEARGFGGWGEWHREEARIGLNSGRFTFLTRRAKALGCPFEAFTIMEYSRIDTGEVAYRGTGVAFLPRRYRLFHPLLRLLGSRLVLYVNQIGAAVAEEISAHPSAVRQVAGDVAGDAFDRFREEESALRNGRNDLVFEIFEPPGEPTPQDELWDLRLRWEKIERLLSTLGSAEIDPKDYRASLSVFMQDPRLAMVKNASIVARIVDFVHAREVGESGAKLSPVDKLAEIQRGTEKVPAGIIALCELVIQLGEVGVGRQRDTGYIDQVSFKVGFGVMLEITEWFFTTYLGAR